MGDGSEIAPLPENGFDEFAATDSCCFLLAGCPSSPPTTPSSERPPVAKHPKTAAATGGRAGTGFLAGIQKPAPARLIRPTGF